MTHGEQILKLIRSEPGLTDREIGKRTGIEPHQQVNRICNRLADDGLIWRAVGPDGCVANIPVESAGLLELCLPETLLIIPCSRKKCEGGKRKDDVARPERPSVLNCLPDDLARELKNRRAENADKAKIEPSGRLPAFERYNGYWYRTAGKSALMASRRAGAKLVIISGGYGLVLPSEPIAYYDQVLERSMWPGDLLERCLAAYARAVGAKTVIGLLAGCPAYSDVFAGTSWPKTVERVFLDRRKKSRAHWVRHLACQAKC